MFVDVPSLNVIFLEKKGAFVTTCTGIVGFDQEMGFNQRFLANIAGNVWGSVLFFPILRHTRPYLRKDMVICWGNCAV